MRSDYQKSVNENFNVQNTQGVKINAKADDRLTENYTNKDQNWQTGKYQGDIYLSVPDDTHNLIVAHHQNPEVKLPENGYPGVSGFFTNEETASKHFTEDGKFDSVGLCHDNQQSPYYNNDAAMEAIANNTQYYPEYNGHLDCFRVNEEKMFENYGTTDFYAAMSKCTENTAWGEGGGFQGYNPYMNEMINNGSLEYLPEKARTCNHNECFDYMDRKGQASKEAKAVSDHIENNNIQGKPNEKLGYNELSKSKTNGDDNPPSDKSASSERGHKPSPADNEPQPKSAERGSKPTENENNVQGSNPTVRGEKPQEMSRGVPDAPQTQRGALPDQTGGEDLKAPSSSSSNPTDKTSANTNFTKSADDAPKAASDNAAQNVVPKTNGMGM